jgi:hypothetical protein
MNMVFKLPEDAVVTYDIHTPHHTIVEHIARKVETFSYSKSVKALNVSYDSALRHQCNVLDELFALPSPLTKSVERFGETEDDSDFKRTFGESLSYIHTSPRVMVLLGVLLILVCGIVVHSIFLESRHRRQ